jgi:uncharacterized surface protein with fasciclin (FAS1) repeats
MKNSPVFRLLLPLLLCLLLLAGCAGLLPSSIPALPPTATAVPPTRTPTPQPTNIIETLRATGGFTTLLLALDAAELTEKLESDASFTLFAPTDEAFASLPQAALQDKARVADVLLYHILPAQVSAEQLSQLATITPLLDDPLTITISNTKTLINDAQIIRADLLATNGVIHVIDQVLIPPENGLAR